MITALPPDMLNLPLTAAQIERKEELLSELDVEHHEELRELSLVMLEFLFITRTKIITLRNTHA